MFYEETTDVYALHIIDLKMLIVPLENPLDFLSGGFCFKDDL